MHVPVRIIMMETHYCCLLLWTLYGETAREFIVKSPAVPPPWKYIIAKMFQNRFKRFLIKQSAEDDQNGVHPCRQVKPTPNTSISFDLQPPQLRCAQLKPSVWTTGNHLINSKPHHQADSVTLLLELADGLCVYFGVGRVLWYSLTVMEEIINKVQQKFIQVHITFTGQQSTEISKTKKIYILNAYC